MNSKQKVNVITLGCSKNLVDSEVMMKQLESRYHIEHDGLNPTDIIIINTCGFINDAKEESVDTILNALEMKAAGKTKKVFVTGCLSQRYKKDLTEELPEVDGFFGTSDLGAILKTLDVDYRHELYGQRLLTTPKHFAYLKISEGCNRNCAFCAIPLIRGKHQSIKMEDLVKEVEFLAAQGVKELLLIAQDLTWYGLDIYGKRVLPELLEEISKVEGIEWIRMHYTYPANFPVGLLKTMRDNPKVCSYLDMPLQHINSRILRSMKRGLGGQKTVDLLNKIKKEVPGIAMRTTLIVGFPGETEEEFQELMDFVEGYRFDRLGVFTYSPEEGTSANLLEDDVPEEVKEDRKARLMELQQNISLALNQEKVGHTFRVIIDRKENDYYVGRTAFDSPEVDNEVMIDANIQDMKIGEFYQVIIKKADFFDLYGEVFN
ncbi:MAG: 30S ribosomal protein S12 methylthiotransferase RimO [Bacteroidetes bacterium HGW-Bacteroidetes-16]|jgi:ribosomal protein S12 methylthiotransferase|nr:MAG: 30S ribosomal protein S12 methylthiotransferase RimO [Bacteroidetes bacterium HGW-Bacteroidetes-16]